MFTGLNSVLGGGGDCEMMGLCLRVWSRERVLVSQNIAMEEFGESEMVMVMMIQL